MKKEAGQLIIAVAGSVAGIAASYWLAKKMTSELGNTAIGKGVGAVVGAVDKTTDLITYYPAQIWAMLSQAMNGSGQSPGFVRAEFFLSSKYITPDYKVDPVWRRSIEAAHVGNPALFNQLLDDAGRIKQQYRNLINQRVAAEVL